MDIKQLILQRRTIHNYTNKPIENSIIENAIECFLHAPNHKHTQPWNICIATDVQRQKLIDLKIELKSQKKILSEIEKKAIKTKMTSPSHLIVILQKKMTNDDFIAKEDYAAIACGIMNMQLYFWSENIGSKWSSGSATYDKKTYEILDIDIDKHTIVGFNWAGYFDRTPPKPKKQNINEVII